MSKEIKCQCGWTDVMGVLDDGEHFPNCPDFQGTKPLFNKFLDEMTETEREVLSRFIVNNPEIRKRIVWAVNHLLHWADKRDRTLYKPGTSDFQLMDVTQTDNQTIKNAIHYLLFNELPTYRDNI
jgi:hypothetical protein